MINRLVTTRQKKFLEKTLGCLGVSIDDLLEINNLKELIHKNKELEEQIKVLNATNVVMANEIQKMKENITELIVQQQNDAYEQILNGFANNEDKE
jgi:cell division protein FtsB